MEASGNPEPVWPWTQIGEDNRLIRTIAQDRGRIDGSEVDHEID
jgi:hypothetical protein